MTTDTSREAVQDLIAEAQVIAGNPFPPMSNRDATLTGRMQDTLAALLDERDGALAGATTLPHEAAMAGTAGEFAARWNSYAPEKREQAWAGIRAGLDRGNACFTGMHDDRIRDLEAAHERDMHTIGQHALAQASVLDKLRAAEAKLDAVKEWLTNEDKATEMSWSDYNCGRGDAAREVLAILADTDEPKDSITFNTDDLGPATDIDGNPLADTDETGEKP